MHEGYERTGVFFSQPYNKRKQSNQTMHIRFSKQFVVLFALNAAFFVSLCSVQIIVLSSLALVHPKHSELHAIRVAKAVVANPVPGLEFFTANGSATHSNVGQAEDSAFLLSHTVGNLTRKARDAENVVASLDFNNRTAALRVWSAWLKEKLGAVKALVSPLPPTSRVFGPPSSKHSP